MKKVFMVKGATAPDEYLKNMLDCIDENGELSIAREVDDVTFCTAESEEESSHTEKVKVDKNRVSFDELYDYYLKSMAEIENGTFINNLPSDEKLGEYGVRMGICAKRIAKLMELKTPEFILQIEKCMFIDSILLYKTNAVGDLYENKK